MSQTNHQLPPPRPSPLDSRLPTPPDLHPASDRHFQLSFTRYIDSIPGRSRSPVLPQSLPASAAKIGSPMFGIGGVCVGMLTPFASSFSLGFSPLEQITREQASSQRLEDLLVGPERPLAHRDFAIRLDKFGGSLQQARRAPAALHEPGEVCNSKAERNIDTP